MLTKIEDIDIIDSYCTDASNFKGNAVSLYIPKSVKELYDIIVLHYSNSIPLTVAGGRTGLVGACVPQGGSLLSCEKLNKIVEINKDEQYCIVQPGVTQSELDTALSAEGFIFPVNPTERNGTLGGNFTTNASGSRTFKYGSMRSNTIGAELLLMNGEKLILNRNESNSNNEFFNIISESGKIYYIPKKPVIIPDVKHIAGYYISPTSNTLDLFIGCEGTLGIVESIKLKIIEKPENVMGLIIFFDSEELLFKFANAIRDISKINNRSDYKENKKISARLIEFYDKKSLELLRNKYSNLPIDAEGAIWIEQEYTIENEAEILEQWFDLISSHSSLADDTWTALDEQSQAKFRDFRHELPLQVYEIITRNKQVKINPDVAVPDKHCYEFYRFMKTELQNLSLDYLMFGHIGNSHIHCNVFAQDEEEIHKAYCFYDNVISQSIKSGGSISAEHGIGKIKNKYLRQMYGEEGINYFKEIKKALDDRNLLGINTLF